MSKKTTIILIAIFLIIAVILKIYQWKSYKPPIKTEPQKISAKAIIQEARYSAAWEKTKKAYADMIKIPLKKFVSRARKSGYFSEPRLKAYEIELKLINNRAVSQICDFSPVEKEINDLIEKTFTNKEKKELLKFLKSSTGKKFLKFHDEVYKIMSKTIQKEIKNKHIKTFLQNEYIKASKKHLKVEQ